MSLFHHHKFEDVGTDYIPGVDIQSAKGRGRELLAELEKLSAGYTVIHQRCECGKYRTLEVLGRLPMDLPDSPYGSFNNEDDIRRYKRG